MPENPFRNENTPFDPQIETAQNSEAALSEIEASLIPGSRVSDLLDSRKSEIVKSLVEEQYQRALSAIDFFSLNKGDYHNEINPPSKEKISEILSAQLTEEQLKIIQKIKKPVLVLIPMCSRERYLEAWDSRIDSADWNRYEHNWFLDPEETSILNSVRLVSDKDRIHLVTGWAVGVTEGIEAPDLENENYEDEEENNPLDLLWKRIEWFKKEYISKGAQSIDFKTYILLQIMAFSADKINPLDDYFVTNTITILVGENAREEDIIFIDFDNNDKQLLLRDDDKYVEGIEEMREINSKARFRPLIKFNC